MIDDCNFSDSEEEKGGQDTFEVQVSILQGNHSLGRHQEWIEETSDRISLFRTRTHEPPGGRILSAHPSDRFRAASHILEDSEMDINQEAETFLMETRSQIRNLNETRLNRENMMMDIEQPDSFNNQNDE